jgi:hypothetical protein
MKNIIEKTFEKMAMEISNNQAFVEALASHPEAEIAIETRTEKDGVVLVAYPRNKYTKKPYDIKCKKTL